ncbi:MULTISPECIES: helix-turn-helix domain-containing protein [Dyella]|uniref:XRE family transcriptional regulator n=2 Tax=Dyella TaxID=231454 RepID=A0A4R0YXS3_9GAMM|nr:MULTISPECIES: helix-turn-helix transcriptional regulator [Dyella]TBR39007.1 XRE family transcriptional regulator [Dyella terrae]TCI13401.1 XRE family transcriptional regulator [Dyella soli]
MAVTPGRHIRRLRRLLGIKQVDLAARLSVTQSTLSRWENGVWPVSGAQYDQVLDLLQSEGPAVDPLLRRLVESSSLRMHLICDRTHRLLAASPSRCEAWRLSVADLAGSSMLRYATDSILDAEAALHDTDWFDRPSVMRELETGSNASDDVPIVASRAVWERLWLADGTAVRLVTTLPDHA